MVDDATGDPVVGAVVIADGRQVGSSAYQVEIALDQAVILRATAPGYQPEEWSVRPHFDPQRGRTMTLPLRLKRAALPPVSGPN